MLATSIHLQRGTPYIYQGEEIGMTNAYFETIEQYRDVESINFYHILKNQGMSEAEIHKILQAKSRDNARTPMQWTPTGGFSKVAPWIEMNKNHREINVEDNIVNPSSILQYYRQLIKLRKKYKVISDGTYTPFLQDHPYVYAFKRNYYNEELIVLNNFYAVETKVNIDHIDEYKVLISNYDKHVLTEKLQLRPYESIVLYK